MPVDVNPQGVGLEVLLYHLPPIIICRLVSTQHRLMDCPHLFEPLRTRALGCLDAPLVVLGRTFLFSFGDFPRLTFTVSPRRTRTSMTGTRCFVVRFCGSISHSRTDVGTLGCLE
eukprot:SAG31_NODE_3302_length_4442_cov_5.091181_2_plen_115_part_00